MNEYHKIKTLYERDQITHKLLDPLQLKNRVYAELVRWRWTEKIDGMNIRIHWLDGSVRFAGKSDRAQLPNELQKRLESIFTPEIMKAVFPDQNASVVLYGEGYGPGIQKGGDYAERQSFILFDILIDNKWWLNHEAVEGIAQLFAVPMVPDFGYMTLADATELVRQGFPSRLNGGKKQAEGLVGRPIETLFDKNGARLICKLKTRDF